MTIIALGSKLRVACNAGSYRRMFWMSLVRLQMLTEAV
jgi:hypothetical protein